MGNKIALGGTLAISEIKSVATELAKKYGAAKVSLFGSYARGEADVSSDIDILLDKGEIKGLRVLDFQEELSKRLGCSVDVITSAGASNRFLGNIAKEEIVLYEAEYL